jgi:hypothetical protein
MGKGFAILMALAGALAIQAPAAVAETLVICNLKISPTNVRSGPTAKDTTVLDKLPNGARVNVLDRVKNPEGTHEWLRVEFPNSQTGAKSVGYVYRETAAATCAANPVTAADPAPTAAAAPSTVSPAPSLPTMTPEPELVLRGHGDRITFAVFSPDGARIVTASDDKTAKIWDARTGALLTTLQGHADAVLSAAFSPGGAVVVTASDDRTAKIWDARTGAFLATLAGHDRTVLTAAFSPDSARIVTASLDKTAKIWDARTGALLVTLSGHQGQVRSAAFSPDGVRIVTASHDNTAKIWDARTGAVLATLVGHSSWMLSAAFSPDGTRIVTGSFDNTAKIWDARTGAVLATFAGPVDTASAGVVDSASFSPDGARIVIVPNDKTAIILDARTGAVLATLVGHSHIVTSATFSPDGARIVTASKDLTARTWVLDPPQDERADIRARLAQNEAAYNKQIDDRKAAAAALECENAKAIDDQTGASDTEKQFVSCTFNRLLQKGSAREMFLAAAKYETAKDREKSKPIFEAIVKRFPNDDLALQSAQRLMVIGDLERVEDAKKEVAAQAAKEAKAAAAQAARAAEEAAAQAKRDQEAAAAAKAANGGWNVGEYGYLRGNDGYFFAKVFVEKLVNGQAQVTVQQSCWIANDNNAYCRRENVHFDTGYTANSTIWVSVLELKSSMRK